MDADKSKDNHRPAAQLVPERAGTPLEIGRRLFGRNLATAGLLGEGGEPLTESHLTVIYGKQLDADRAIFQKERKTKPFRFQVGERIIIPSEKKDEVLAGLVGTANELDKALLGILLEKPLEAHVVNAADPDKKPAEYYHLVPTSTVTIVYKDMVKRKPYYELLVPEVQHMENASFLVLLPQELVERIAGLHPEPTSIMPYPYLGKA